MNARTRTGLLLLLLFMAAWLPRIVALDRFVTIDERKWLARSANFYQAVSHGDLANTFQREHPGVTVMWAGTLGFLTEFPAYAEQAPGQFAWDREYLEEWLQANTVHDPLALLAAGRWWVVLFIALAVTVGFFPLRTLLGTGRAVAATLLIAWTPFYVALSRQLHPDGLVSSLIFLALLSFLAWLYGGRRPGYLILSGVVMGLAWLTKTPAIFLVPTGAVLVALAWRQNRTADPTAASGRALLAGYVLWGVIATAVFVLLWPAMWLDPVGTLLRMAAEMSDYVERHTNVNYFMGAPVDDPGPIFYPIAWLFRTTPVVLIGLAAAAVQAWRRRPSFDEPRLRRTALALLIFALIFTAGMTLGAKKFDRYILPVFLALNVVAGLGWWGLAEAVINRRVWSRSRAVVTVAGTAVVVHGLFALIHAPYYLTYYNPLLGGGWTAPRVLFAGWGEGLDEAARWLNTRPEDAENLRVVSWYHDGPLSYFFHGQAVGLSYADSLFWLDTDYTVVYINQRQRQLPSPEAIAYFDNQEPVHRVRFGGMDLARIYDMRGKLLPDFVQIGKESAADFGELIRLAAYDLGPIQVAPGDRFPITLYLQSLAQMQTNYNVLVRLVDVEGREIWREEGWPWGAPTRDWPIREIRPDGHEVVIPADAPAGLYRLTVAVYDPETLDRLPVTSIEGDALLNESEREIGLVQVGPPPEPIQPVTPVPRYGQLLALTGAEWPAPVAAGTWLDLQVQWEALGVTADEYTVFLHLVNQAGEQAAQQDRPPLFGFAPTRIWRPGQQVDDLFRLELPPDLPPGDYTIRMGFYLSGGDRLPVLVDNAVAGDFVTLGPVRVE